MSTDAALHSPIIQNYRKSLGFQVLPLGVAEVAMVEHQLT